MWHWGAKSSFIWPLLCCLALLSSSKGAENHWWTQLIRTLGWPDLWGVELGTLPTILHVLDTSWFRTPKSNHDLWTEPGTARTCRTPAAGELWVSEVSAPNLVSVVDIGVRKSSWHQLKQHHPITINVRLEGVRVAVLHPDHLGSLESSERKRSSNTLADVAAAI